MLHIDMIVIHVFTALRLLVFLSGIAVAAPAAAAPDRPDGIVNRETMWPAPTADDWKRPCLITWQRTWEDALSVSHETGKPILVCVNMDGEIASEHYAGIRYRRPETASLYEPYVCVIASVYRHNPRDYDEEGQRILCPRFGSVTCGEHISIEPGLFKEFFDDKRIAPRHIGVELDGKETYDVYYTFDTDSVFNAIRNGIENRDKAPPAPVHGDRTIVDRIASRDIRDRIAVEAAYRQGDRAMRRSLLEAAIEHPEAAPVDLLRLAVFSFDTEEIGRLARRALARSESGAAVKLIAETLRFPMETSERDALIAALARLGGSSPRAQMLATVHQGLAGRSSVIDTENWAKALEDSRLTAPAIDASVLEARWKNQDKVFESGDADQHVELAEAFLAFALEQSESEMKYGRSLAMDARHTALEAEKLGAAGWRVNAVAGLAAHYLGDVEEAYARAEAAVKGMPPGTPSRNAMAVLELFAEERRRAIVKAVREKRDWPSWSKAFEGTEEWLTDLNAAYSVLDRHPCSTDAHVAAHCDFLKLLGALGHASRVLHEGLARFPDSWILHDRLRGLILREKGVDGLESVYGKMLREKDASPNLGCFAGYASLVAAEFHRRAGRNGRAFAAYNRGIAHYEHWIEADRENGGTADHYVAIAFAGLARLAYEQGDYEGAVEELLKSFKRRPEAAGTRDGLGITPANTAWVLLARLSEMDRKDLAEKLERALADIDPELLSPSAYEREPESMRKKRPRRRSWRGQ